MDIWAFLPEHLHWDLSCHSEGKFGLNLKQSDQSLEIGSRCPLGPKQPHKTSLKSVVGQFPTLLRLSTVAQPHHPKNGPIHISPAKTFINPMCWDPARPLEESPGPFGPEISGESPKESPGAFRPRVQKVSETVSRESPESQNSLFLRLRRLFRDCFGHFLDPGPEGLGRLFRRLFGDFWPERPGRLL